MPTCAPSQGRFHATETVSLPDDCQAVEAWTKIRGKRGSENLWQDETGRQVYSRTEPGRRKPAEPSGESGALRDQVTGDVATLAGKPAPSPATLYRAPRVTGTVKEGPRLGTWYSRDAAAAAHFAGGDPSAVTTAAAPQTNLLRLHADEFGDDDDAVTRQQMEQQLRAAGVKFKFGDFDEDEDYEAWRWLDYGGKRLANAIQRAGYAGVEIPEMVGNRKTQSVLVFDGRESPGQVSDGESSPRLHHTETPEFRRWFGDSRVVDSSGKPLVVYHGTSDPIEAFDPTAARNLGGFGADGIFFTDLPEVASGYANQYQTRALKQSLADDQQAEDAVEDFVRHLEDKTQTHAPTSSDNRTRWINDLLKERQISPQDYDRFFELDGANYDRQYGEGEDLPDATPNVMPVYLSLQHPLEVDAHGLPWDAIVPHHMQNVDRSRYDGIIFRNIKDSGDDGQYVATTYVAFRPEQIKSATGNRGTWERGNPKLNESRTVREEVAFEGWVPYEGKRGGKGWQWNGQGRPRYQEEKPRERGDVSPDRPDSSAGEKPNSGDVALLPLKDETKDGRDFLEASQDDWPGEESDSHKIGEQVAGAWRDKASDQELKIIKWYRDGGYRPINQELLTGKVQDPEFVNQKQWDLGPLSNQQQIEALDGLLTRNRTTAPVVTYRGSRDKDVSARLLNTPIGQTFVEPAFLSTSISPQYAWASFTDKTIPVVARIEVPQGMHALYLSDDALETELLLPHGLEFQVTGRSKGHARMGQEYDIVHLRIVGQNKVAAESWLGIQGARDPEAAYRRAFGPRQVTLFEACGWDGAALLESDADWDPNEHPRELDGSGRFADKGEGGIGGGTVDRGRGEQAATYRDMQRSRKNPVVEFPKPIVGPSGASLNSYEWKYEVIDEVDDRGEERKHRVSDWESAVGSDDTGRDIVHHFHIRDKNGHAQVVSLESALKELGYVPADAKAAPVKGIKNLGTALKQRGLAQLELDRRDDLQRRFDAAIQKATQEASKLPVPAIEKIEDQDGFSRHRLGDVEQRQGQTGGLTNDLRAELEQEWRSRRTAERFPLEIGREAAEASGLPATDTEARAMATRGLRYFKQDTDKRRQQLRRLDQKIEELAGHASRAAESAMCRQVHLFEAWSQHQGPRGGTYWLQDGDQASKTYRRPGERESAKDLDTGKQTADSAQPDLATPRTPAIETPEFKAWFRDSKVVSQGGKPLVVYHSTTSESPIEVFDSAYNPFGATPRTEGFDRVGVWFTGEQAEHDKYGSAVYPVYLSLKNPLILTSREPQAIQDAKQRLSAVKAEIESASDPYKKRDLEDRRDELYREIDQHMQGLTVKGNPRLNRDPTDAWGQLYAEYRRFTKEPLRPKIGDKRGDGAKFREYLRKQGYDGIILRDTMADTKHPDQPKDWFIVFDPEQIKSAIGNRGTYDPKNPNINESDASWIAYHGPRGGTGWENSDTGRVAYVKERPGSQRSAGLDTTAVERPTSYRVEARGQQYIVRPERQQRDPHGRLEGDFTQRELAAHVLDRELGGRLVPRTEYVTAEGGKATRQPLVAGESPLGLTDLPEGSQQAMAAFDFIIGAANRRPDQVKMGPDGNVQLVNNGRAFYSNQDLAEIGFGDASQRPAELSGEGLAVAEMVLSYEQQLRPQLLMLLPPEQVQDVFTRARMLIRNQRDLRSLFTSEGFAAALEVQQAGFPSVTPRPLGDDPETWDQPSPDQDLPESMPDRAFVGADRYEEYAIRFNQALRRELGQETPPTGSLEAERDLAPHWPAKIRRDVLSRIDAPEGTLNRGADQLLASLGGRAEGLDGQTALEKVTGAVIGAMNEPAQANRDLAQAIQYAAAERFGGKVPAWADRTLYEQQPEVFRAIAQGIYDNTQNRLRAAGIPGLVLYRGLDLTPQPEEFRRLWDTAATGRGAVRALDGVQVNQQPVASWTQNPYLAHNAAVGYGSNRQMLLGAWVPADKIFSLPFSGPGDPASQEVMTLGEYQPERTRAVLFSDWRYSLEDLHLMGPLSAVGAHSHEWFWGENPALTENPNDTTAPPEQRKREETAFSYAAGDEPEPGLKVLRPHSVEQDGEQRVETYLAMDQRGGSKARTILLQVRAKPYRAAEGWAKYDGPKGGRGWKNTETGKVQYGEREPGRRSAKPADRGDAALRGAEPEGGRGGSLRPAAGRLGDTELSGAVSGAGTARAVDGGLRGLDHAAVKLAGVQLQDSDRESLAKQGLYLHGTSADFTQFKPGGHGAIYLSSADSGGRVTQAEHIASGPFGGRLVAVKVDQSMLKKFDPLNDSASRRVWQDVFGDKPVRGYVDYTDMPDLVRAAKPLGYNAFQVYEPSVQGMSLAVTEPTALQIVGDSRLPSENTDQEATAEGMDDKAGRAWKSDMKALLPEVDSPIFHATTGPRAAQIYQQGVKAGQYSDFGQGNVGSVSLTENLDWALEGHRGNYILVFDRNDLAQQGELVPFQAPGVENEFEQRFLKDSIPAGSIKGVIVNGHLATFMQKDAAEWGFPVVYRDKQRGWTRIGEQQVGAGGKKTSRGKVREILLDRDPAIAGWLHRYRVFRASEAWVQYKGPRGGTYWLQDGDVATKTYRKPKDSELPEAKPATPAISKMALRGVEDISERDSAALRQQYLSQIDKQGERYGQRTTAEQEIEAALSAAGTGDTEVKKFVLRDPQGSVVGAIAVRHTPRTGFVEIEHAGSVAKGGGTALVRSALEFAVQEGKGVFIQEQRTGSEGFWAKLGFDRTGAFTADEVAQRLENLTAKDRDVAGQSERSDTVGSRAEPVMQASQAEPRRSKTETPEFKAWFGDSKVVDAEGKPLVVYHGTKRAFDEFDPAMTGENTNSRYGEGAIFFTDNSRVASDFAWREGRELRDNQTPNVVPVYLAISNPKVIDAGGKSWLFVNDQVKAAREEGYDGVIVKSVLDHGSEITQREVGPINTFVVFDPTKIKSAIGNRGTFDPNSPKINESIAREEWSEHRGPRGGTYWLQDGDPATKTYRRPGEQEAAKEPDMGTQMGSVAQPDLATPRHPAIETPEFKRWFGKSKIVDKDGNPLRLYHGTTADFVEFQMSDKSHGIKAAYFTDNPQTADNYVGMPMSDGEPARIIPVYVRMENPLVIDDAELERDVPGYDLETFKAMVADVVAEGKHDGIIVLNARDDQGVRIGEHGELEFVGGDEVERRGGLRTNIYIAFDPTQIKSAIGNRGTFDTKNPKITESVPFACHDVALEGWVEYDGPLGGEGWKNTETGKVRYVEEMPGGTRKIGSSSKPESRVLLGAKYDSQNAGEHAMDRPKFTRTVLVKTPETLDEAIALATAARASMIGDDDDDHAVNGDCEPAARAIASLHPDWEVWSGEFLGSGVDKELGGHHVIVKAGEYFIDITHDQFGGSPMMVFTDNDRERLGYGAFRRARGLEQQIDFAYSGIAKDLEEYEGTERMLAVQSSDIDEMSRADENGSNDGESVSVKHLVTDAPTESKQDKPADASATTKAEPVRFKVLGGGEWEWDGQPPVEINPKAGLWQYQVTRLSDGQQGWLRTYKEGGWWIAPAGEPLQRLAEDPEGHNPIDTQLALAGSAAETPPASPVAPDYEPVRFKVRGQGEWEWDGAPPVVKGPLGGIPHYRVTRAADGRQGMLTSYGREGWRIDLDGDGSYRPVAKGGGRNPIEAKQKAERHTETRSREGDLEAGEVGKQAALQMMETALEDIQHVQGLSPEEVERLQPKIEETKTIVRAAWGKVVNRFGPKALEAIGQVNKVSMYADQTELAASMVRWDKAPEATRGIQGVYRHDDKTGELLLSGAGVLDPEGTYAHELTHAVDGPQSVYSSARKWRNAWKAEIGSKQENRVGRVKIPGGEIKELVGKAAEEVKPGDQLLLGDGVTKEVLSAEIAVVGRLGKVLLVRTADDPGEVKQWNPKATFYDVNSPEAPPAPLSRYAQTSASEGFAEFGRLLVADPARAKREFPKCWKCWREWHLVEEPLAGAESYGGRLREYVAFECLVSDLQLNKE